MENHLNAICAGCAQPLDAEVHYLLRLELISTPASPPLDVSPHSDIKDDIDALLKTIAKIPAETLNDSVYYKVEHLLCIRCRGLMQNHLLLPTQLTAEQLAQLEESTQCSDEKPQ